MNVDTALSRYRKSPSATTEFTRAERRHLDRILRRLQFLEHKEREEGMLNPHSEQEVQAFEWILIEVGFLLPLDD